jgi:chromate reductase, NAD(P)H dehydrogenase (quinone)
MAKSLCRRFASFCPKTHRSCEGWANHHLRQSLVFLDIPAMAQPEAHLGGADKLFDASGKLANDGTRKFLQNFMNAFDAWITANSKS